MTQPGPGPASAEALSKVIEAEKLAQGRPGTVTRRVVSSTAALLVRSAWERALSLIATLAVARLLTPRDVGLAAVILSIVAVATIVVDAGVTTSLVRRGEPLAEARFAAARRAQFMLAAGAVLAAGVVWVARPGFGMLLFVDSLQLLGDPLVLQPKVMLQRALDFRGLALADGLGVLTRAVVSLGVAFADRGPAALVLGDLSAALVFTAIVVGRLARRAPRAADTQESVAAWSVLREGAPFQAFGLMVTLRDLSTSAVLSGLVGLRALGLFQFAVRAMSPVLVIFTSLTQLAVPIGVHVIKGDDSVQRQVRQGYLLSGVVTAAVLACVAAPAPWLIPHVFGPQWQGAVPLIFALALALVISGPAATFALGLLLAANHTRFATAAGLSCTGVFLLILMGLHFVGGLGALVIAWDISAFIETTVIVVACRRKLGVFLARPTALPIPIFLLAYGSAHVLGSSMHGWVASAAVAVAVAAFVSALLGVPIAWRSARALVRATRARPPDQVATS